MIIGCVIIKWKCQQSRVLNNGVVFINAKILAGTQTVGVIASYNFFVCVVYAVAADVFN